MKLASHVQVRIVEVPARSTEVIVRRSACWPLISPLTGPQQPLTVRGSKRTSTRWEEDDYTRSGGSS